MSKNYTVLQTSLSAAFQNKSGFYSQTKTSKNNWVASVLLVVSLFFVGLSASAQVTVTNPSNTTPAMSASYGTLALAIADINNRTAISGPVIITLAASSPQTAPAGGYVLNNTGITGGSNTNRFIFDGNGNTVTASAAHTVSLLSDAIFKIIGADFITIQGFTMLENPANTVTTAASNTMTEFGVALFYASTTDGAQNNIIQNSTIDLNRTYQNTFGIYSNSTHTATNMTTSATATGVNGGNSGLKIYGNTITDVNNGIVVLGPTAAADYNTGVDIGGASATTANTITNFGTTGTFSGYAGVSATVYGIFIRNSIGFNVSYNSITSSVGGVTSGTLRGIFNASATVTPSGTFTNTINNNTIALTHGSATGTLQGITVEALNATSTSIGTINNNNFTALTASIATSATITAISSVAPHLNVSISGNTFTNLTTNTSGSFIFLGHNYTMPAGGTQTLNNNSIVTAFNKTAAGGTVTISNTSMSSPTGTTATLTNNNFSNITLTGATIFAGFVTTDGPTTGGPTKTITGNTVNNITGGSSAITGMSVGFSTSGNISSNVFTNITGSSTITGMSVTSVNQNVSQNTISGLSSSGAATVTGIIVSAGTTNTISKNKIFDLSGSNIGSIVNGITVSGGTTVTISNNIIGDLRAPAATITAPASAVTGINLTSTTASSNINVYYNTVYLNASSSGTNFGTSGIFHAANTTATTAALNLRNNLIVNNSTSAGTGTTAVFRRSSGLANTLANYASTSNNNFFFTTAGLYYADGTSTATTMAAYKTGAFTAGTIAPRDAASVSDTVSNTAGTFFRSFTGVDSGFLHLVNGLTTQAEGGAATISGFADDFDGDTRNVSTPDIGADEFNGTVSAAMAYVSSTTTQTNTTNVSTSTTNQQVIGIEIVTTGATNALSATSFTINTNGTTSTLPTDIANAKLFYTGTNAAFAASTQFGSTVVAPSGSHVITGSQVLAEGINYFWLTYDVPCGAIANAVNVIDGECNSITIGVPQTPTIQAPTGSRLIVSGPLSGTRTVGTGGNYARLSDAFTAINSVGLGGNLVLSIISDITETASATLNQWSECGGSNFTLTIQPDAATVRTISVNVDASMIILNGADRVTIDGRFGGSGSFLSFINNNTPSNSASVFSFINGASNNTLRNLFMQSISGSLTGCVFFSTSSVAGGNSNNTITANKIRAYNGTNFGNVAIYSSGTVGSENSTNTISDNEIYSYSFRGLDITATGSSGWTITSNSFYNEIGVSYSAATNSLQGIRVQGGGNYTITGNYIGSNAPLAAGTNVSFTAPTTGLITYTGISLAATTGTSNIKGNVIKGVNISCVPTAASTIFNGISVSGAGIVNIGGDILGDGNTIGSNNANSNFIFTTTTAATTSTTQANGIVSSGAGNLIRGNQVGGFDINNLGAAPAATTFFGIVSLGTSSVPPMLIADNVVGSAGSGASSSSIRFLSSSISTAPGIVGITHQVSTNAVSITNNTIKNITNQSTTAAGLFNGVFVSNAITNPVIITGNTIDNISSVSTANAANYLGISCASITSTVNMSSNTITNISTLGSIIGISQGATGTNSTSTIGANTITGLSSTGAAVIGISSSQGSTTANVNNNSIRSLSSITSNVTGLSHSGSATTANIFKNTISDLAGNGASSVVTGLNVAAGTTVTTSNNRIGDLRASAANAANAIVGIGVTGGTTQNVYFNTVNLAATSSGAVFGSSAISVSTTPTVTLNNNNFVNSSTANGAGLSVAYRRSSSTLTTHGADSERNNYSAATVYTDGTTPQATIGAFKTLVGPTRDANSLGVSPSFLSTTSGTANFLKLDPAIASQLESGAANIAGITDDFENTIRQGNPGYIVAVNGGGTAPDIGADEYDGIPAVACSGTPVVSTINGAASVCSGFGTTLSLSSVYTDLGITYQWSSGTTLGGPYPNTLGTLATQATGNLTTTTYYICTVTCNNGGGNIITVEKSVIVNPLPTVVVTPNTGTICTPSGVAITLVASGATTYTWSPSTGLSFTTGNTVTANPTATTTYTVTGSDVNGCVNTATSVITVVAKPDAVTITPATPTICAGATQILTAIGGGSIGTSTTIGAGTSFTSATGEQTAFCNRRINYVGQTIYTAAELSAAGVTPGNITSLAYNISSNGDANTNANFTVKIGHVGTTAIFPNTTFFNNTAYTTVYGPATYTRTSPVPGFQTITFSTPFVWNGIDNICIDVRHDGIDSINNAATQFTTTTGNASLFGFNTPATGTLSTTRLNIRLGFSNAATSIVWSPLTGLFTDAGATIAYTGSPSTTVVYAQPASTQIYTATSTNVAGCQTAGNVTVTVNPLPTITLGTSPSVCIGTTSANLTYSATTGSPNQYSINYDATAEGQGFVDVVNATLPTTPILLTVPSGAAAATYNATITVINSTSGCVSAVQNVTVSVGPTKTYTAGSWTPSAPTSSDTAIISSNYNVAADITACSLTVNNNAVVTIPAGNDVTLVGALTVSSGSFTLENTANLIQTTNVSNSGNIIVKRNSSPLLRSDYTMWSSPVTGQGLYGFSPFTFDNRFYQYVTATNLYDNSAGFNITGLNPDGVNGTDSNNVQFTTAKGYLIRMPWNHPTAPTVWNGQFTGVPNNGNVTFAMTTGFNAVGNPYPSRLNVHNFIDGNTNISGPIYFWRKTNNPSATSYATLTKIAYVANSAAGGDTGTGFFNAGDEPNWVINVGQGFIVQATSNTNLSFDNSMRRSSNSDQFFRNPTTVNTATNGLYWLNLTNSQGNFSQMAVGYSAEATVAEDRGIDGKNFNPEFFITSLIGQNEYAIQGRPEFADTDVVPLSFKVETAGSYSITIDHTAGLFTGTTQAIYLRDNQTGSIHNLRAGAYNFASAVGTFNNRFEVVYRSALDVENPSFTADQVVIYKNNVNDFVITSGNVMMASVRIFDIRGRLLAERKGINASQTTMTVGNSNEVLLVQVTSDEGDVVTKKVIR